MITSIYIQGFKLDLFEDDNIELKSAIADAEDISKVFTDSTNSFSVPATENNNKAFKHFYNSKLVDSWDIFNKITAVIELNGVFYKELKLKLNSVVLKSNKPTSYSVQLFGLLTELKDLLGDDKLTDLDLSAYDFEYNSTNVSNKLIVAGLPDTICTTLSTKRLVYDSDSTTLNTDDVKNVAFNNTGYESGLPFENTSASLLNLRIIEAIENDYGITFSRDFFGQNQFNNLYLLLNNGGAENILEQQVVFDSGSDPTLENNRILLSTNSPDLEPLGVTISVRLNKSANFTTYVKSDDDIIFEKKDTYSGNGVLLYNLNKAEYSNFQNLTFYFKAEYGVDYQYEVFRYNVINYLPKRTLAPIEGNLLISSKIPKIKIIDYLSGLIKAFKLIAINTTETNVFVDSLENYYKTGKVKQITKYVDFSEIPISTGEILSEINYKFKEPTTLLQNQFYKNNDVYYGDLEFKLVDENDNLIDGGSIDVELPFENMIYETISDLSGSDNGTLMYGYMVDENLEPVTVEAHLHYTQRIGTNQLIKVLLGSDSYTTTPLINVACHTLGFSSPQYSTVFGNEFNEYNGVLITNTLYSNFHKSYIDNLFYKNRRIKKIKCKNLPIDFLINLKLNDVIEIKDDYYRINNYNLNLITKECDFELYNVNNLNLSPSTSITTDTTLYTTDTTLITTDNNS